MIEYTAEEADHACNRLRTVLSGDPLKTSHIKDFVTISKFIIQELDVIKSMIRDIK